MDGDGNPVVAEFVVGRGAIDAGTAAAFTTWEDDPREVDHGSTDDDGTARVERVPPGIVTVVARELRVAGNQEWVEVGADATRVEVRLPSARENAAALASVEGEVVDGEGRPFARWSLTRSNDRQSDAPVGSGRTFRFDGMLPGTYVLGGWATGAALPIARRLTVAAGQQVRGCASRHPGLPA